MTADENPVWQISEYVDRRASEISTEQTGSLFEQKLSRRELEICDMIAKGLSNQQISDFLYISVGTIKNYITSIYYKLGFRNRVELTKAYMSENGLAITEMPSSGGLGCNEDETWQLRHSDAKLVLTTGSAALPGAIPLTVGENHLPSGGTM
jgi:DNA-binding CsgD family transcriptional regulator